MSERLRRAIPVVIGLVLFVAALEVLRIELRHVTWHELTSDLRGLPIGQLGLALVLMVLSYTALTGYDLLAFAYIGRRLPRLDIALTAFLAYAISHNVGFGMISGTSVRYRFYTRWGVSGGELSRIILLYGVSFWLGLVGLGGLTLAIAPLPDVAGWPSTALLAPLGWLLMLVPPLYLVATIVRRRPLRIWRFELPLPSPGIAAGQVLLSAIDWTLAGAVLYVLLPAGAVPFVPFLGLYLTAVLLGLASHVPGGVGVFEGLMVVLLRPFLESGEVLPALVAYRVVYYLVPLAVALALLVGDEALQRRAQAARIGAAIGRVTEQLTPRLLAMLTFFAGVLLLFSGATPPTSGRLDLLSRVVPVGAIEASHFAGSVTGVALLILSHGLSRRLDAAYHLTVIAIAAGMTASLLKGFDFEEVALLSLMLVILRRARPAFDRPAAFWDTRFSAPWIATVVGALAASVWLGLFAFRHVNYSHELWWQFAIDADAPRFLRASVGAALALLSFALIRLIGHAPNEEPAPSDDDLATADRVIAAQPHAYPHLVHLRDKAVLFSDDRRAFLMYGVQGRTWVVMGDPVGAEDRFGEVIRRFLERCDDFGGVPVFYEVGTSHLHRYADVGLTFVKMGEEATVDLTGFTLEGSAAARYRHAVRRLDRDGASFRVVEPAGVTAVIDQLRAVSDDWLATRTGAEKGFSLGFFDARYLARCSVAVIERGGHIVAFANLWTSPTHEELSADLMRFRRDGPRDVMETLLVHVMLWGSRQGYRRFSLGMAPLSGFEESPVASLWSRIGAFVYEHGEPAYHFQGLRAYKEKFNPAWESRYLVYPGGMRLPRILADVTALIAGGYLRVFRS